MIQYVSQKQLYSYIFKLSFLKVSLDRRLITTSLSAAGVKNTHFRHCGYIYVRTLISYVYGAETYTIQARHLESLHNTLPGVGKVSRCIPVAAAVSHYW